MGIRNWNVRVELIAQVDGSKIICDERLLYVGVNEQGGYL